MSLLSDENGCLERGGTASKLVLLHLRGVDGLTASTRVCCCPVGLRRTRSVAVHSWVSLVFLQFSHPLKTSQYSSSLFPRSCFKICLPRRPTQLPRFSACVNVQVYVCKCVGRWQGNTGAFLWIFLQVASLEAKARERLCPPLEACGHSGSRQDSCSTTHVYILHHYINMGDRIGARPQLTNVKDAANSFREVAHSVQVLCARFTFLWRWFASD